MESSRSTVLAHEGFLRARNSAPITRRYSPGYVDGNGRVEAVRCTGPIGAALSASKALVALGEASWSAGNHRSMIRRPMAAQNRVWQGWCDSGETQPPLRPKAEG